MIKHIVMWKLKDTYEGKNKQEIATKIKEDLESLKNVINKIKTIEVGINFNDSAQASDVVLYSEFENEDDLNTYQNHPEHIRVAGYVRNVNIERVVVDYTA
ncbi:Dabb family protein [Clostridium cellulovorans]|uniref:Stress responsive alpha-beta barrel domain-containing protein n=1 Tax=Clostridium cellulovorans (strain ATCC 35296 / DSM 3052 / OCM 3 / 743B) TaxID=573061 RepID=D9SN54_CLOC7|nr:Dabb family protein [Clostridium cellulovorans]ADL51920.1 Stress responsive alpha-beta barrel domain-containing protein [Clostridium cellulovorans 743B]